MQHLSEKENSEWTLKKTLVRIFAYLFCVFLIWLGINSLKSSPLTTKDKMRGTGQIIAACVYLFVDIRILILKNKQANS